MWSEYKQHVGEGPGAQDGNHPLFFSLADLCQNDQDGVFDRRILTMLTSSSWSPKAINGVNNIRETIHRETVNQFGPHIATSAPGCLAARLIAFGGYKKNGQLKQGNTPTPSGNPSNIPMHLLKKSQRDATRKKTIYDKYYSMEREVQINVVSDLPVDELAAHLALTWCAEMSRVRGR